MHVDDAGRPLETGGVYTLVLPLPAPHTLEAAVPAHARKYVAVQYAATVTEPAFGLSWGYDPPLAVGATQVADALAAITLPEVKASIDVVPQ
jgi:hypothetical protein